MRALAYNPTACALMGVNNNFVISFTFGLGSALAGAAGILTSIQQPSIDPLMGILPGLKAFVAAVLGGIGNLGGAVLGGIVETLVVGYVSPTYRDAVAFAVLILILLLRPAGLLGKNVREKV
jgi:branched-chain amino acid transport system permease protein